MSFLQFQETGKSESGKTKIVTVSNVVGLLIGSIRWYGPWRKYTFQPGSTDMVFDHLCLRDIADYCEKMTNQHRSSQK